MIRTRVALTASTLLSSLMSFAAYTLLLKHLGASARVDTLFYAASIPISAAGIMSGVLLYLLPPRLTQLNILDQEATTRVLAFVVVGTTATAILFALLMYATHHLAVFWLIWMGFANIACLLILSTLASCLAQARGTYLITGIAPLLASIGLFAGCLGAIASMLEWLMVIGQLIGAAAGLWWLVHALRLPLWRHPARDFRRCLSALKPLRRHALAITLGTIAFTLFQPIDAALCTQLSSGSVSIMSYAQRVLVAVGTAISLGAYAIAARTTHDAFKSGGHAALCRQANRETRRLVIFGLLVWAMYELGGNRLLALLLSASIMSQDDLARLLECIGWMLLGVGPMAAMPYLFRVFYSSGSYRKPAVIGIGTAAFYAGIAWPLLERFDILAMAYAYCFVWWTALLSALAWLNRQPADPLMHH